MPRHRLRAPHLHAPTKSVRVPAAPATLQARAEAFRLALPDDVVFSHVTAAQLWGLSLPESVAGSGLLDVMRVTERTPVRRAGCRGHRGLEARRVMALRGLPVVELADTWVDLGGLARPGLTVDDLVVVGDEVATRLIGPPDPGEPANSPAAVAAAIGRLRDALGTRVRLRGRRSLAEALELVRAPVRSPMETRARLMFVRAGFPEPAVNVPVLGEDGQWLLEGDLVWEEEKVVGEYQGRDHGSIRQRSYDAERAALAGDDGWRVLEIFSADVYHPPRRASCLRRFARALGLDPARLRLA
jgi:hypothetical protein